MKYKEWIDKEYFHYKKIETIRKYKQQPTFEKYYTEYENSIKEDYFNIYDKYYEKDLEKYKRIKEETEQWFLDSLY